MGRLDEVHRTAMSDAVSRVDFVANFPEIASLNLEQRLHPTHAFHCTRVHLLCLPALLIRAIIPTAVGHIQVLHISPAHTRRESSPSFSRCQHLHRKEIPTDSISRPISRHFHGRRLSASLVIFGNTTLSLRYQMVKRRLWQIWLGQPSKAM